MHIKDIEKEEADKEDRLQKRRKAGYGADSDTDSDDEGASNKMKTQNAH